MARVRVRVRVMIRVRVRVRVMARVRVRVEFPGDGRKDRMSVVFQSRFPNVLLLNVKNKPKHKNNNCHKVKALKKIKSLHLHFSLYPVLKGLKFISSLLFLFV